MKAVILAAGFGTRMRPITHTGPKQLLPLANKPVIQYTVEKLRDAGITELCLIVGYMKGPLMEFLGDGSGFGVKIIYRDQLERKGLAHAVSISKDWVGDDSFIVLLGDIIFNMPIKDMVGQHEASGAPCSVALFPVNDPEKFGVAEVDDGTILRVVEKPKEPKSNLAIAGIYFFSGPEVWDIIGKLKPSARGEYELTDTIETFLERKRPVNAVKLKGSWKDTGQPEDLLEGNRFILNELTTDIRGTVSEEAVVRGAVAIGKGSTIGKDVIVRGPVTIGEGCTVGPDCIIGPYVSIGNNVTVKNTSIEESIVMDDCNLDYPIKLVNSILGRAASVGVGNQESHTVEFVLGDHSFVRRS